MAHRISDTITTMHNCASRLGAACNDYTNTLQVVRRLLECSDADLRANVATLDTAIRRDLLARLRKCVPQPQPDVDDVLDRLRALLEGGA